MVSFECLHDILQFLFILSPLTWNFAHWGHAGLLQGTQAQRPQKKNLSTCNLKCQGSAFTMPRELEHLMPITTMKLHHSPCGSSEMSLDIQAGSQAEYMGRHQPTTTVRLKSSLHLIRVCMGFKVTVRSWLKDSFKQGATVVHTYTKPET